MCIFSTNVNEVSSTKIFARMEDNWQYIVYELILSAQEETAMVLPIPIVPNTDTIEFIDLSGIPDFFQQLDDLFPKTRGVVMGRGRFLNVQTVGNYEASFVPSLADFARLDPRFRLEDNIWKQLPTYEDYAFVVFKFKSGNKKIHPMAFKFPTRYNKQLFYPTVHVHDGVVHETEHFDHILFIQGDVQQKRLFSSMHMMAELSNINQQSLGVVANDKELYKDLLMGELPNQDVWVGLN